MATEKGDSKGNTREIRDHGSATAPGLFYSVDEAPSWPLSIVLGLQNYLTAASSLFSVPILLSQAFCMDQDTDGVVAIIGTMLFVSGLATFLQTTFGVRLPIVQGATAAFIAPTLAIMKQPQWACQYTAARDKYGAAVNFTMLDLPEVGSEGHREIWKTRLREIQGAIMVASLFQIVIGFSGIIGLILRFVGPLTVVPTVTLVGLSLFPLGSRFASQHWWIALVTIFLVVLFSQYLKNITIPLPASRSEDNADRYRLPIFNLFPVLLAMLATWGICAILTATDALPNDPTKWGYLARTDTQLDVLEKSNWFRFPYPGQWGKPTVSVASVFGILAGVIASMVESIGDYYACARLAGAPPPPDHAVNRGIGMEGLCCLLDGAWGSGNGTTSSSQNIGAIGLTKVGSRRVVQCGGVLMMVLGCLGKFGAIFAIIPGPIVGGMLMVTFGMVVAVGLSNLQYVDLNSNRNIFIIGLSIFFGLSLPMWLGQNQGVVNTGSDIADQIVSVLFSTSMFVGGLTGFVLDNTIPGTEEERGIKKFRQISPDDATCEEDEAFILRLHVYDLPLVQGAFNKIILFKYIPFCPTFLLRIHKGNGNVRRNIDIVNYDSQEVSLNLDRDIAGLDSEHNSVKL